MNASFTEARPKLTIACFSIPEDYQSVVIDRVVEQLRAADVAVYSIELAGAGAPLLDLEGVTYVGEHEIQGAIEELIRAIDVELDPLDKS